MEIQELTKLIYENNLPQLKKLKDDGVDFSILDSYTKGNLLIAYSSYGYNEHYTQKEMVEFLLESGIDVNYQANGRNNSKSALHNAVAMGHMEIVKSLITNGAILEIKDRNGNTPLWNKVMMCRGQEKDIEMIELLVSKGSSFDTKNNHNSSARDIINDIGLGVDNGHNKKEWDLRYLIK